MNNLVANGGRFLIPSTRMVSGNFRNLTHALRLLMCGCYGDVEIDLKWRLSKITELFMTSPEASRSYCVGS